MTDDHHAKLMTCKSLEDLVELVGPEPTGMLAASNYGELIMAEEYHKIQSIFKRTTKGDFIWGEWSTPELAYLAEQPWTWTEKVDGTNIRIWHDGDRLRIGGRTDRAQIPTFLLDAIFDLNLEEKLAGTSMKLYGEGYGAKIQKGGGNYRRDNSFVLFDVNVDGWWLKREAVQDVAESLGIECVPEIGEGTIQDAIDFVTAGFNSTWGDFEAEGLVCRPRVQLFDRQGKRIICKVKATDLRKAGRMK